MRLALVVIELTPMADLVHADGVALNSETKPVRACAKSIRADKITRERLGAAHVGPIFQSLKKSDYPAVNGFRKLVQLFGCRRR